MSQLNTKVTHIGSESLTVDQCAISALPLSRCGDDSPKSTYDGTFSAHLLCGCEQVETVAADENGTAVAAEYVAAMARRLADATES